MCFFLITARLFDLITDADTLLIELVNLLEVLLRHDRVDVTLLKRLKVPLDLVKVLSDLGRILPVLNLGKIVLYFAELVQVRFDLLIEHLPCLHRFCSGLDSEPPFKFVVKNDIVIFAPQ